jgi:hypothetical protein
LDSVDDITEFLEDLLEATEEGILIEGIDEKNPLVDKAVEIVYSNTAAKFADGYSKNPFLALALWKLCNGLDTCSINACLYCLNLLHEMAPTDFEKARLLLLSQCDTSRYGEFILLPKADWDVIDTAIGIFQHQQNGRTGLAADLLGRLRETGQFRELLATGAEGCGMGATPASGVQAPHARPSEPQSGVPLDVGVPHD